MKKAKNNRTATKTRKAKAPKKTGLQQTAAGKARAEGLRLYKLAGKPTREQVILVYGKRGPVMTWEQRAKAGVPARKFQADLFLFLSPHCGSSKPSAPRQTSRLSIVRSSCRCASCFCR
jgi:hypothetical protein